MKAVIFDLGGVLLNLHFDRAVSAFAKAVPGVTEDAAERILSAKMKNRYEKGEWTTEEFYHALREELNADFSFSHFKKCWENVFSENRPVTDLLPRIGEHCRLALLSNTNELHMDYIEKEFSFCRYFDDIYLSYKLGLMKPSKEIFDHVSASMGVEPGQCLFIDDSGENVKAAEKSGMEAIHFRSSGQLLSELETRGMLLP